MAKLKLYWKVGAAPTGRYRSFDRRPWPSAWYGKPGQEGSKPAVWLHCDKSYNPALVREGLHGPITITLLHHTHPERGASWKVFTLKQTVATLDEAKRIATEFLEAHPEWHPKKENDNV